MSYLITQVILVHGKGKHLALKAFVVGGEMHSGVSVDGMEHHPVWVQ